MVKKAPSQSVKKQEQRTESKSANKFGKKRGIKKGGKSISNSAKASLVFPVGRISRLMRKSRLSERFSFKSAVAMASLLEYFTSEVLEIAGDICLADDKHLIQNRHLV